MQYGLPAFGDLCALASQKNYMSLYVCESDLVKAHLPQLGKVSCGKGCIRRSSSDHCGPQLGTTTPAGLAAATVGRVPQAFADRQVLAVLGHPDVGRHRCLVRRLGDDGADVLLGDASEALTVTRAATLTGGRLLETYDSDDESNSCGDR